MKVTTKKSKSALYIGASTETYQQRYLPLIFISQTNNQKDEVISLKKRCDSVFFSQCRYIYIILWRFHKKQKKPCWWKVYRDTAYSIQKMPKSGLWYADAVVTSTCVYVCESVCEPVTHTFLRMWTSKDDLCCWWKHAPALQLDYRLN